jgi:4-hydroxybenzoate polyprenyltransferase
VSASSTEPLRAYVRERYPARRFVPLAAFLAAAALLGGRGLSPIGATEVARAAAVSYILVFPLRLWDDLRDRERDRLSHPERVLSRAHRVAPFVALLTATATLGVAAVAATAGAAPRLAALALLGAALALWYRARRALRAGRVLDFHVILTKYPVVVYVAAPAAGAPAGVRLLLAMAVVYFSLCAYEVLHDDKTRAAPGASTALAVELALLGAAGALLVILSLGG